MTDARIDVHAHYITERYRAAATAAGHSKPDGVPGLPPWSPELALGVMDRLRIGTAMLSVSSPGVHFGDAAAARDLCRAVNEEGAEIAAAHPGRFGLFATLPLPDVEPSLREIEYALDNLGADGIALKTNHAGVYLGDAKFDPVFDELDRRKAVVFIHPTSPACPCCTELAMGYPRPMIEFFFETTRAVTNLILSGALERRPNLRLIIPHAGATLPVLAERIAELAPIMGLSTPTSSAGIYAQLRRLYYDMAGFPIPRLLDSLLGIADADHLLYGSDWPFTPEAIALGAAARLENTDLFDPSGRAGMFRANAQALFPRLGAIG